MNWTNPILWILGFIGFILFIYIVTRVASTAVFISWWKVKSLVIRKHYRKEEDEDASRP